MPVDEAFVREVFAVIFEREDWEAARKVWKPGSVDHILALGLSATGPDELEAFFRSLQTFARQIGLLPAQDSTGDRALMGAFNAKTRVKRAVLG